MSIAIIDAIKEICDADHRPEAANRVTIEDMLAMAEHAKGFCPDF